MKIQETEDNSNIATIFFLPKNKGEMMIGKYWHCGVIYNGQVYETFDQGYSSITHVSKRMPELKKEKAVFLETKIYPEKLDREVNSGTSCEQFSLRVMGMSNLKGTDKGNLLPSDVYKIIQRKKYNK